MIDPSEQEYPDIPRFNVRGEIARNRSAHSSKFRSIHFCSELFTLRGLKICQITSTGFWIHRTETHHAQQSHPEEFIGFPGAFMSLGAGAVLGTLWPVNDRAAALLTARFYDEHIGQGLAPAAALRQAQLWLQSATRAELVAYVRSAAARGRLEPGALHPLEAGIDTAAQEQDRFFKPAADKPPPAAGGKEGDEPGRPFAHPIYWGGFVMTGQ